MVKQKYQGEVDVVEVVRIEVEGPSSLLALEAAVLGACTLLPFDVSFALRGCVSDHREQVGLPRSCRPVSTDPTPPSSSSFKSEMT